MTRESKTFSRASTWVEAGKLIVAWVQGFRLRLRLGAFDKERQAVADMRQSDPFMPISTDWYTGPARHLLCCCIVLQQYDTRLVRDMVATAEWTYLANDPEPTDAALIRLADHLAYSVRGDIAAILEERLDRDRLLSQLALRGGEPQRTCPMDQEAPQQSI